ncbi:MAG: hypothetical protein RIC29_17470 [Rhodospirillaceae bacterium]
MAHDLKAARGFILALMLSVLVSACATSPGRFSDTPDSLDEKAFTELIGPLRPQQLHAGQCGLFLWTRSEERELVFFGNSDRAEGKMMIADEETTYARVSAEGGAVFGQHPRQTFQNGDVTVTLILEIEGRANMSGGAVVPRGSLRFEQTGGWKLVLPVGGLIACQPG